MSVTSSPADVVKTRIMSQCFKGGHLYHGSIDCFIKTFKSEGIIGFYKGFWP